jgi:hypothetical protein
MKRITFLTAILMMLALSACMPYTVVTTDAGIPPDDESVSTECVTIVNLTPLDIKPKGSVVLQDYNDASKLILMNLENGAQTPMQTWGETAAEIFPSPDRKTVAYKVGEPGKNIYSIVVADAQGNLKKEVPWKDGGFFILKEWINNDQLLISANPPLLVLNPYTGERKGFHVLDFPDYSDDPISGNRYALFDFTMDEVLYAAKDGKISLVDMKTKKVLGTVDNKFAPYPTAAWSPDNSKIVVIGSISLSTNESEAGYDLFTITRDGQVKRLTRLTDHYGKLFNISAKSGLNWSPDGRFIAFWLSNPQNPKLDWQLAVVDTTTGKTTNYCIPSHISSKLISRNQLPAPMWSQDGTQLLVEHRYDIDNTQVVVLDIAKKTAVHVMYNMYPAAWLFP